MNIKVTSFWGHKLDKLLIKVGGWKDINKFLPTEKIGYYIIKSKSKGISTAGYISGKFIKWDLGEECVLNDVERWVEIPEFEELHLYDNDISLPKTPKDLELM